MKINKNFILRQVVDMWVVLPLADRTVDFNGMITLNESGVLLWRTLEKGSDVDGLVEALLSEYDVSVQQAQSDVAEFLEKLRSIACLEET